MDSVKRDEWTTKEQDTLKYLKARGWSNASIARELGRTPKAVALRWNKIKPKKNKVRTPKDQLCAYCIHAVPDPSRGIGCNWSMHFQPVPGWKAVPTKVKYSADKLMPSYSVSSCPRFKEG